MLSIILSLIVTGLAGWVIARKYKPQGVLFLAGIVLMALSVALGAEKIDGVKKSTGFIWFDIFESVHMTFSSQQANIGLLILVVAAFAAYMEHVGASAALVELLIKPLKKLRSPYLLLALAYVVGQHINIVVPSAAGLGMLMMATLFPTLVRMGVHPLAAAAVMATTPCLDLGPASGQSNVAGQHAGMDGAVYFAMYQLKIMYPVIFVIALAHFIVQKYFDRKEGLSGSFHEEMRTPDDVNIPKAPLWYAILPIIPLVLVFIFSPLIYSKIKLHINAAIFLTILLTVLVEIVRTKNYRTAYEGFNYYLKQLGVAMDVVLTMVAGSVLAAGLKTIGAIDVLINFAQTAGFGQVGITIVMVLVIVTTAFLCGSSNAAFFAFAALAPDLAHALNFAPILLLMPMQLSGGLARSISPVSGVVIACAGMSRLNPLDLSRRTAIPMIVGIVAIVTTTLLFF